MKLIIEIYPCKQVLDSIKHLNLKKKKEQKTLLLHTVVIRMTQHKANA